MCVRPWLMYYILLLSEVFAFHSQRSAAQLCRHLDMFTASLRLKLTGAETRQHGAHWTVNMVKSEIRWGRNTCLKPQKTTGATTVQTHCKLKENMVSHWCNFCEIQTISMERHWGKGQKYDYKLTYTTKVILVSIFLCCFWIFEVSCEWTSWFCSTWLWTYRNRKHPAGQQA